MFAAVSLRKSELNEGGSAIEPEPSARGMTTDRAFNTQNGMITDSQPELKKQDSEEDELTNRMRTEAKLRIALEDQVTINPRIATLFEGLKLNSEHNSAVVYPLLYMVSRVVYALSIVYLSNTPQVATLIVLSCTILLICFTLHERQFKDSMMNNLAIINDVLLYLVLVLSLSCSCVTTADMTEKKILGWTMIVVVTLSVHINFITATVQAIRHIKLMYQRRQNLKALKAKAAAQPEKSAA